MSALLSVEDALALVREHGVMLVSAQGPAPRLVEAIAGEPVAGSWWGHPRGRHIYAVLQAVTASEQVLVCRLVGGKLTLVHRRLWPALVRLADRGSAAQLAQVREEHTATGRHATHALAFPDWVPADVLAQGRAMDERAALGALGRWLPGERPAGASSRKA